VNHYFSTTKIESFLYLFDPIVVKLLIFSLPFDINTGLLSRIAIFDEKKQEPVKSFQICLICCITTGTRKPNFSQLQKQ